LLNYEAPSPSFDPSQSASSAVAGFVPPQESESSSPHRVNKNTTGKTIQGLSATKRDDCFIFPIACNVDIPEWLEKAENQKRSIRCVDGKQLGDS
jgi:hypothetical protein